ncbi:MAG: CheR family methyltransferase [Kiloniellales bacterium]|nr:CheR family methyltransferase [Kiloniellales bacterium]
MPDLAAYREHLERDAAEWQVLDGLCRITISRFYRDRGVFDQLRAEVLPALCRDLQHAGERTLSCLSLGCCGGEEPFTLQFIWHFKLAQRFPDMNLEILATDSDPQSLARAARGRYSAGSLKDLPREWRDAAFDADGEVYSLRREFRRAIRFLELDLRDGMPAGMFHLVLCRNLVFTYFDKDRQLRSAADLAARMPGGGILVLGKHERLPVDCPGFEILSAHNAIFRRL